MKIRTLVLACASLVCASSAQAQSWQLNSQSYAIKSGESIELMDLYWVLNCRSQLNSLPEVTVLDGPPGVTATVSEALVTPRFQQCPKPVKGGKLMLKAEGIDDQSQSMMTIRVTFNTKDGPRQRSLSFTIALFPAS